MKTKKGFSLIEVVVSMSIFVLVMISFSLIFSGILRAYYKGRNINENVENAQFAMSLIGKTARTSTLKSATPSVLVIYDYSQGTTNTGLCIRYSFIGTAPNRSLNRTQAIGANEASCDTSSFAGVGVPMTSGDVAGSFSAVPSVGNATTGESTTVGKVTIRLTITTGSGSNMTEPTNLQTTVSLRDYGISNIGIDVTP